MAYDLTGTIHVIQEPMTFASGFTKREFVVEVEDGKYPQFINLECLQDKVSLLDDLRVGDRVHAKIDIRGREHNGRYFNSLVCWNVKADGLGKSSEDPAEGGTGKAPLLGEEAPPASMGDDDDIPF